MNGILIVDKPQGITSFSAVAKVKRFCSQKRVGHAGTLDPLATGVLPMLIGKAAAMQEVLSEHDKSYRAGIRLGTVTDTADTTGSIVETNPVDISDQRFTEALNSFIGKTKQVPPMYSAIQVNGKRLYELARNGVEIEREARDIEIYSACLVRRESETDFIFDVSCSKGTYIRTLCEDIGKALGTGACMYSLQRTRCGHFSLENAVSLDSLEMLYSQNRQDEIEKLLIPCEALFSKLKAIKLSEFFSRLCLNGCEIYISKLKIQENSLEPFGLCRLYSSTGVFIGVAELKAFPDGKALKLKYRFI